MGNKGPERRLRVWEGAIVNDAFLRWWDLLVILLD
jgi:hypothetical protein